MLQAAEQLHELKHNMSSQQPSPLLPSLLLLLLLRLTAWVTAPWLPQLPAPATELPQVLCWARTACLAAAGMRPTTS
jgi:hypothetical protein